jgi:hypothetical protein
MYQLRAQLGTSVISVSHLWEESTCNDSHIQCDKINTLIGLVSTQDLDRRNSSKGVGILPTSSAKIVKVLQLAVGTD